MATQETNVSFNEQVSLDNNSNTTCIDVASSNQPSTLASLQTSSLNNEGSITSIAQELSERLFKVHDFKWSNGDGIGKLLKRINVPDDIIAKALEMPNGSLIMPYMFAHFDSYFKIIVNCNRFQVGQLQISWNYLLDGIIDNCYNHFHLASQRPHAIFSASANNVVEITIPYCFMLPYVCLRKFGNNKDLVNMASLEIRVLSPLMSNASVYSEVVGVVMFAFKNFKGHGMVPLNMAMHEMLTTKLIEGALKGVINEFNCDNPSNPHVKSTIIPYASHSWANGTNVVEELNLLRLDPTSTTPHPNKYRVDEMSIPYITRVYGLISNLMWKFDHRIGTILNWYPVCPVLPMSRYSTTVEPSLNTRTLEFKTLPPIAVISSLFGNWRGGIEFRIDIIRTMMHTGRLIFSYIPGASKGKVFFKNGVRTPTIDDLFAGYYVIMDLGGDQNSFSYTVPYISNRPWLTTSSHCRTKFDELEMSHGNVFLAVVNALVPMDAVPNYVYVNVYVRAGFDFNLSIPIKPLLGLSWNKNFSYNFDKILFKSGYYPCFAGSWRSWVDNGKSYYILRYGNVVDHIAQVEGKIYKTNVYKIFGKDKGIFVKARVGDKVVSIECKYFYIPYKPSDSDFAGYNYLIPCPTHAEALKGIMYVDSNYESKPYGIEYVEDSDWWANNNIVLIPMLSPEKVTIHHEMDERKTDSIEVSNSNITSTVTDVTFYNENFKNLKDLCRRYQLYAETAFRVDENYGFGAVVLIIPLYPCGLKVNYKVGHLVNDSFNYTRDGVIPIIASGFRYFRGGLRFKVIITGDDGKDIVFSMTHSPDCYFRREIQFIKPTGVNRDFVSSGYAMYNQSTRINEIFEFEIPYYMQGDYCMSVPREGNSLSAERFGSLGSLSIAIMSRITKVQNFSLQMYYALADDARFSQFQGFPSMMTVFKIPGYLSPAKLQNQIDSDWQLVEKETENDIVHEMWSSVSKKSRQLANHVKSGLKQTVKKPVEFVTEAATEGMIDGVMKGVSGTINTEAASSLYNQMMEMLNQVLGPVADACSNIIRQAVAQLLHVFYCPTIMSVITSIVSFLVSIGVIGTNMVSVIISKYRQVVYPLLQRLLNRNLSIQQQGDTSVEHEFDSKESFFTENETSALTATAIAVIAAGLGLKGFSGAKGLNYFRSIMNGIRDFSFCANTLTIFIRNNISCFMKCARYVGRKINRHFALVDDLESCGDRISEWAKSVKVLTHPMLREQINEQPKLQYQVFIRDIEGQALTLRNDISPIIIPEIRTLANKIRKLQEELVADKLCPAARQEPFCIQFFGDKNIGKSYLIPDVVNGLLDSIGYKTYSDPVYVRNVGNQYWNGVGNQPAVWFDDVFCVTTGEECARQMREIFALKSSSVFNPPIAELENKKLRYNPKLMVMTSNQAFWPLIGLSEPSALYRRRDSLWEVKKKDCYQDLAIKDIDRRITSHYGHLLFRKAKDSSDAMTSFGNWVSYEEFSKIIEAEYKKFEKAEMINYRKRIQDLTHLFPIEPENDIQDLFESSDDLLQECFNKIEEVSKAKSIKDFKSLIAPLCDPTLINDTLRDHDEEILQEFIDRNVNQAEPEMMVSKDLILDDIEDIVNRDYSSGPSIVKDFNVKPYDCWCAAMTDKEWDPRLHQGCYLHPTGNNKKKSIYSVIQNYFAMYPNQHSMCSHVYLNEDYALEASTTGEYSWKEKRLLKHMYFPSHPKIDWDYCNDEDCFLKTPLGQMAIKIFLETSYYSDIHNLATVQMDTNTQCDFPKFAALYLVNIVLPIFKGTKHILTSDSQFVTYSSIESQIPNESIVTPPSLLQKFYDFCRSDRVQQILSRLYKVLKFLGIAVATCGLMTLGVYMYKNKGDGTYSPQAEPGEPPVDPELHQSGTTSTFGSKPNKAQRLQHLKQSINRMKFVRPESEVIDHVDVTEQLLQLFHRNMAYLSYYDSHGNEIFKQRLLGLCGSWVISTKHFIEAVEHKKKTDPNGKIIIRRGTSRFTYSWKQLKTVCKPDSSYALIYLSGPLTFKNIRKHIATADEHGILASDGLFVSYDQDRINTKEIYLKQVDNLNISGSESCSAQTLDMVYSYNHHGNGLCGSPILSLKPVPKIIGIHVAGSLSKREGYAQPILQEYFTDLETIEIAEMPADHEMKIKPLINLENNVLLIGTIPRELSVHMPSKSKIVPTPMFDQIIEHTTEPAPMSLYDERIKDIHKKSPLVEGVAKHGLTPLPFDHDILDECADQLSELLINRCKPVLVSKSKELLSDQEIFGGIIGNDLFGHIELNSSEGYPLMLERPKNHCNKKWLFDYEDSEVGGLKLNSIHPSLKELMSYNNNLRQQGKIPSTVFVDCLKDARIDKEKIKIPGKTRVFSVAPVEYTWVMKKYFGQFQAAFSNARFHSETAIGINTQSAEWTSLYHYLVSNSRKTIVGDYKAFGDRLYWYCIHLAFKIIRKWYSYYYGDKFDVMRTVLELELRYSTRLVANVAYRTLCGIPSGFPLTVEINNMVNQLYMRYAFKILTGLPIVKFNQYCRLVCYGDDLIMTVAEIIQDKYSFSKIQQVLGELLIEFTPADKTTNSPEFWDIDEVTFLKSKFIKHPKRPGVLIPQLPLSSCVEELNWMWSGNDEILTCYEASRGCLNNLYGHGPGTFNQIRNKILDWFNKQDPNKYEFCHLPTWEDIDRRIFEN